MLSISTACSMLTRVCDAACNVNPRSRRNLGKRIGGVAGSFLQPWVPFHNQLNSGIAQQAVHPAEYVQFRTFDVDLDDVRRTIHDIIQRYDGHLLDAGDRCVNALREQAVDAAGLAAEKQIADLVAAPHGDLVDFDVVQGIDGDVFAEVPW